MSRRTKRWIQAAVVAVVAFAGVSIYTDMSDLGDRLAGFDPWAMVAALALALFNYLVRFGRWSLYLRGAGVTIATGLSARIFLSGFALAITPGKLGELIKSYLIREFTGDPITKTAPLVVGERVTDLVALLLLGLVGVSMYGVAENLVYAGCALVGAALVAVSWPRLARGGVSLLTLPAMMRRFRAPLLRFYDGLAKILRPWPLCWATAFATVAWLAECVGFAVILSGFPGTEVPLGLAMLIYAATTVAGALSFLPGGLLVTEATMAVLLASSSRGVDEPTALAATILIRLATLWFAVVIGAVTLAFLRKHSGNTEKALESATRAAKS